MAAPSLLDTIVSAGRLTHRTSRPTSVRAHGFKRYTLPPHSIWVNPSGAPITLRANHSNAVLRVAIDPGRMAGLMSPSLDSDRPGFADQAHLTRLFKLTYGITPGALVRRIRA